MPNYLLGAGDASIACKGGLSASAADRDPRWPARSLATPKPGPKGKQPAKRAIPRRVTADDVLRSFNTWAFKREQPSDRQLMSVMVANAISTNDRSASFSIGARAHVVGRPNQRIDVWIFLQPWQIVCARPMRQARSFN
jgi:hypothetical protein